MSTVNSKRLLGRLDLKDANITATLCHLFSTALAIAALLSNDWIIIESDVNNQTSVDYSDFMFQMNANADRCESIGCRDFWKPARFGGFIDQNGRSHIAFHSDGRVILDCITPAIANLFYILIALCFVVAISSSLACSMNLVPPPGGFLLWIRNNSIMELSNMMLTLCTCVCAIIGQSEVAMQRPNDDVTIGSGVFFVCISGLLSFVASMSAIRHSAKQHRMRRIDNQRLLCARSLRSWRDAARRPDDTRPIVDFERYLDECSTEMTETNQTEQHPTQTEPVNEI
ncbi:unnamed protein product [Caenorhabditis bovis]|uniref:Transmembrane protein 127 transmembrane region domain-containing protein n=1 Tax=Caenorhabditis bovis TaxID=2654633 RepID=A0A8S1E9I2_9PELO|nr:unnamed protein product [Caenorhabditis bovis]